MKSVKILCGFVMLTQLSLSGSAGAMSGGHHSFLGGPWELFVQMGLENEGMSFPVTIADCNKVTKLEQVFPVIGTPLKVKLEKYLPDLRWETTAKKSSDGAFVAKVAFKGEKLNQEMWLSSSDMTKQSISSSIGGIRIAELHDGNTIEKLAQELKSGAIGVLTVWPNDSNTPTEFIVLPKKKVVLPNSPYKISMMEYVPRYSYDTEKKKVSNLAGSPLNPAIKVSIDDGNSVREGWVWEKFGTYPHMQKQMPLRMAFTSLEFDNPNGSYLLLAARGAPPQMLCSEEGKLTLRKVNLGEPFALADKKYSLSIESLAADSIIETTWKNNSENLLNPALIVTLEGDAANEQIILELGKPSHQKTKSGTLALLYRHVTSPSKETAK